MSLAETFTVEIETDYLSKIKANLVRTRTTKGNTYGLIRDSLSVKLFDNDLEIYVDVSEKYRLDELLFQKMQNFLTDYQENTDKVTHEEAEPEYGVWSGI